MGISRDHTQFVTFYKIHNSLHKATKQSIWTSCFLRAAAQQLSWSTSSKAAALPEHIVQSTWRCSYLGAKGTEYTSAFSESEHMLWGSSCSVLQQSFPMCPKKAAAPWALLHLLRGNSRSMSSVSLQRVSIACHGEHCTSYSKSICPSDGLSVRRWHCVKTTQATIMRSSL